MLRVDPKQKTSDWSDYDMYENDHEIVLLKSKDDKHYGYAKGGK